MRIKIRNFTTCALVSLVGFSAFAQEAVTVRSVLPGNASQVDRSKPDLADQAQCAIPFPQGIVDSIASVAVKFDIDEKNQLLDAKIFYSSGNSVLDKKVLAKTKQCNFQSALKNGEPVAGSFIKEFVFSIPGEITPFSGASESSIESYSYYVVLNSVCPTKDGAREAALAGAKQHMIENKRKAFKDFPPSPMVLAIRKTYDDLEKKGPGDWQVENFKAYF